MVLYVLLSYYEFISIPILTHLSYNFFDISRRFGSFESIPICKDLTEFMFYIT